MKKNIKKAKEEYKIGDLVMILVHNSHYREIGEVCGFDLYNEFNLKVKFDEGRLIHGYMTNEVCHIPRLCMEKMFDVKELKKITKKLLKYKI